MQATEDARHGINRDMCDTRALGDVPAGWRGCGETGGEMPEISEWRVESGRLCAGRP